MHCKVKLAQPERFDHSHGIKDLPWSGWMRLFAYPSGPRQSSSKFHKEKKSDETKWQATERLDVE